MDFNVNKSFIIASNFILLELFTMDLLEKRRAMSSIQLNFGPHQKRMLIFVQIGNDRVRPLLANVNPSQGAPAMKLKENQVEQVLDQLPAEVIPDDHPTVPQLESVFGPHTFF